MMVKVFMMITTTAFIGSELTTSRNVLLNPNQLLKY